MNAHPLTIGRLARAADVNIETIRYYQRRKLLPTPNPKDGAFRLYPPELIDRIRFIKRAQELGFTLREIEGLLALQDGANRRAIRSITGARLDEIRAKLADLQRMERVLSHLIHECEANGAAHACPIIAALTGGEHAPHASHTGNGRTATRRASRRATAA